MTINVRMLAFHDADTIRKVEIPDDVAKKCNSNDKLLENAFYFGQNEFCHDRLITSTTCSVSVGDVIELPDSTHHLVLPFGFLEIPDKAMEHYIRLARQERVIHAYTIGGRSGK
jgi:hypothetical protein